MKVQVEATGRRLTLLDLWLYSGVEECLIIVTAAGHRRVQTGTEFTGVSDSGCDVSPAKRVILTATATLSKGLNKKPPPIC